MASLSDTSSSNPYYHGESYDSVIGLIIGITTIIGSITTFAFIHVIINISNNLKNINKVLSKKIRQMNECLHPKKQIGYSKD